MLHMFLITEKYVVIPDLPLEFNIDNAIKNNDFVYAFNETARTRYGFNKRTANDAESIIWIETDPHYVFHFCNAWDDTNDQGHDLVVVTGCVHLKVGINLQLEHLNLEGDPAHQDLTKFVFNLNTREYKRINMYADHKMEFPICN